jgi:hypothetical protein
MSWRRWKLGVLVSIVLSLIVAGTGLCAGMHWQAFVAVLCTALGTHFCSFIKDHPIEQISFDTDRLTATATDPMTRKNETLT